MTNLPATADGGLPRSRYRSRCAAGLCALLLAFQAGTVIAQNGAAGNTGTGTTVSSNSGDASVDNPAALEQQVRRLAEDGARAGTPGGPRIEVSVGQLDARLHLAPCARIEPYLPDGMRLWGRGRIGLRCTQGAVRWNVYLPVTVKAFGTALVATGSLGVGAVLGAADITQAEVDLAEDASAAVQDPDIAVGRVLARTLRPGQSVRQSHLKVRQWFTAGETVSLSLQGPGFSVESEGQALGNGMEGQPVRVRTESGRVVTGQPVGGRRVALSL